MTFKEFMNKCYAEWSYIKDTIEDYEIDFFMEKAEELGFDKLELARIIADARDKYKNGKKIMYNGLYFDSKNELASYLGMNYNNLLYKIGAGKIKVVECEDFDY